MALNNESLEELEGLEELEELERREEMEDLITDLRSIAIERMEEEENGCRDWLLLLPLAAGIAAALLRWNHA